MRLLQGSIFYTPKEMSDEFWDADVKFDGLLRMEKYIIAKHL